MGTKEINQLSDKEFDQGQYGQRTEEWRQRYTAIIQNADLHERSQKLPYVQIKVTEPYLTQPSTLFTFQVTNGLDIRHKKHLLTQSSTITPDQQLALAGAYMSGLACLEMLQSQQLHLKTYINEHRLQLKDLDIQEGEDFFAAIVAVRMNTRVNERIQNILLKRQLKPLTIGVHLNRCEPVSFGWNNAVSLYLDTDQNTQITTVRGKGLLTDFATRHLREQIGLVSAVGMYASVGRFFEEHPEVLSL